MYHPLLALMAALLPLGIVACDSDSSPVTPPESLNIIETAADAGTFQTLIAAVDAAGLTSTLQGPGPYTVFAPTDQAFNALPDGTVEALLADQEALSEVLLYHVVPGRIMAADLSDGQIVQTADGREFRVTISSDARVNGVNVSTTDVEASNGVIHVIDAVLIPVEDNVDTAIGAGFETLVAAVQAAGLEDALRDPEARYTIFAPTDEAFDALPEGTLEALLDDPEALAQILLYHVVDGRVFAGDLVDGMEATTLQGETVTISLNGGAQVNGTSIIATDVFTANGVVHVIDAVLLPPEN